MKVEYVGSMDLMQGNRNENCCLYILGVAGAWCRMGLHHVICEKQSAAAVSSRVQHASKRPLDNLKKKR